VRNKLESALKFLQGAGFSGTHCIFTSLAVRDFLREIGIKSDVKSVALVVTAAHQGLPLHRLGVGMNKLWNDPYEGPNWDGHLVVTVPGYLIDPTFHAVRRKAWGGTPDVAIVKRGTKPTLLLNDFPKLPVIATKYEHIPEHEYQFQAVWFSYTRNNDWKTAPDFEPLRRQELIRTMWDEWERREHG